VERLQRIVRRFLDLAKMAWRALPSIQAAQNDRDSTE
jgi:hypothetical protein